MKKLGVVVLTLSMLLIGLSTLFAGNSGAVQPVKGIGADVICAGTPFTVTGMVVAIGIPGEGVVIDTGATVVTIYGIGSLAYWDANNIVRPAVGEVVTITGYVVELTDSTLNIAASITVAGVTLDLRDALTCAPLWRAMK
ncbi:MAG TPA: hypothetical protein DCS42_12725 [Nitrospiraceae bacterium]|jgi:hypothetical protein|nr:hypothetical protein [Nitrospiraceae bacterium]